MVAVTDISAPEAATLIVGAAVLFGIRGIARLLEIEAHSIGIDGLYEGRGGSSGSGRSFIWMNRSRMLDVYDAQALSTVRIEEEPLVRGPRDERCRPKPGKLDGWAYGGCFWKAKELLVHFCGFRS